MRRLLFVHAGARYGPNERRWAAGEASVLRPVLPSAAKPSLPLQGGTSPATFTVLTFCFRNCFGQRLRAVEIFVPAADNAS